MRGTSHDTLLSEQALTARGGRRPEPPYVHTLIILSRRRRRRRRPFAPRMLVCKVYVIASDENLQQLF